MLPDEEELRRRIQSSRAQDQESELSPAPCRLAPPPPHNITHNAKCHTGLQESKKVLPSREWPLRRKPSSLDPEEHKVLVVIHGNLGGPCREGNTIAKVLGRVSALLRSLSPAHTWKA